MPGAMPATRAGAGRMCCPTSARPKTSSTGRARATGSAAPIGVSDTQPSSPASRLFLDAAVRSGIPRLDDLNTGDQHGIALVQGTIRNGRRMTTAVGYLRPAATRENLRVVTEALVDRIVVEDGIATGVIYTEKSGATVSARAEREVVLSAGAVASPQILLQSGIGDADQLKALGIAPVHHLPGVGENLHDHLFVFVQPRLKKGVPTLNRLLRSRPRLAAEVLRYGLFRTGATVAHLLRGLRLSRFQRAGRASRYRDHLPPAQLRPAAGRRLASAPLPWRHELGLRHPAQEPGSGDAGAGRQRRAPGGDTAQLPRAR